MGDRNEGLFLTHATCPSRDSCCSDSCHLHSGMQADGAASRDPFWSEKIESRANTPTRLLKLPPEVPGAIPVHIQCGQVWL